MRGQGWGEGGAVVNQWTKRLREPLARKGPQERGGQCALASRRRVGAVEDAHGLTIERVQESSDCRIELLELPCNSFVLGDERYINNLLQNAVRFSTNIVRATIDQSDKALCLYQY